MAKNNFSEKDKIIFFISNFYSSERDINFSVVNWVLM